MPQVLSKFIKNGVDFIRSKQWKESLGQTLQVTGKVVKYLENFCPGARYFPFELIS